VRFEDFCDAGQRNRGFAGEDSESECLLEIQPYESIGMAEVADRNILPDVEFEVAASRSQNERTFDRRRPDKVAVNDALDVLQDRISVIAGLGERRILPAPSKTE
jgi:hypothetical protein